MSKEIIYEDDTIIVYEEYDPAQHIYDNDEINLWKFITSESDYGKEI